MNRLCTICARAGSKGVKNKNLLTIENVPLVGIAVLQALKSNLFTKVAVSSDSLEILSCAKEYGADITINRPPELASDLSGKIPAIQHAVKTVEELSQETFPILVDLDATSPLRLIEDIKGAVHMLESSGCDNVITGCPSKHSPYFSLVERKEDGFVELAKKSSSPILRRQDAPECYDMNGAIYVWKHDQLFYNQALFRA